MLEVMMMQIFGMCFDRCNKYIQRTFDMLYNKWKFEELVHTDYNKRRNISIDFETSQTINIATI